ncbi:hypothetical protein E2562_008811 [Oryza meyeriana var. granulata]|uniref:Uncharacterized protein n=1 Tax=Oryza meyeriana var. granulata TaxID=110450 RepID=A0A6G1D046_9ORYZ|nr:hypothetical protein E2562_008811 [Oryza meyeriana var. granulata]
MVPPKAAVAGTGTAQHDRPATVPCQSQPQSPSHFDTSLPFLPPLPSAVHHDMLRWSSPKDPALEAALRRNRRWIVNNQIKRLLLRFPSRTAPVRLLQSCFKTLDLLGRAAN